MFTPVFEIRWASEKSRSTRPHVVVKGGMRTACGRRMSLRETEGSYDRDHFIKLGDYCKSCLAMMDRHGIGVTTMTPRSLETLDSEIRDILVHRSHYGSIDVRDRVLGYLPTIHDDNPWQEVHWIGREGETSSVGQAIRLFAGLNLVEQPVTRVLAPDGEGRNMLYYVVSGTIVEDWRIAAADRRPPMKVYVVGGCTDYSGEGNHGRELMERYMEIRGWAVQETSAQFLIGLLANMDREGAEGA